MDQVEISHKDMEDINNNTLTFGLCAPEQPDNAVRQEFKVPQTLPTHVLPVDLKTLDKQLNKIHDEYEDYADSDSETDYADVDPSIPGQKYCLMSFVSPPITTYEKLAIIYVNDFLKEYLPEIGAHIDYIKVMSRYEQWKIDHPHIMRKLGIAEFGTPGYEGYVKFRGVFRGVHEAKEYSKKLQDEKFNIMIGKVGWWLPFSGKKEDAVNQETSNKLLNTMIKRRLENQKKASALHVYRQEMAKLQQQEKINSNVKKMKKLPLNIVKL